MCFLLLELGHRDLRQWPSEFLCDPLRTEQRGRDLLPASGLWKHTGNAAQRDGGTGCPRPMNHTGLGLPEHASHSKGSVLLSVAGTRD